MNLSTQYFIAVCLSLSEGVNFMIQKVLTYIRHRWSVLVLVALATFFVYDLIDGVSSVEDSVRIQYVEAKHKLASNEAVKDVVLTEDTITFSLEGVAYRAHRPEDTKLLSLLEEREIAYEYTNGPSTKMALLFFIVLLLLFGLDKIVKNTHLISQFVLLIKQLAKMPNKERFPDEETRQHVAIHECGHAILAQTTYLAPMLRSVTCIMDGNSLGHNSLSHDGMPIRLYTRKNMLERIRMYLGGRVAEEIVWAHVNEGATNDLQEVYSIANEIVTTYGMSRQYPNVAFPASMSDAVRWKLDQEIAQIIAEQYDLTTAILERNRELLGEMSEALLQKGILTGADLKAFLHRVEVP